MTYNNIMTVLNRTFIYLMPLMVLSGCCHQHREMQMQCKKSKTTQCCKASSASGGSQIALSDKAVQITPGNSAIYDNISITAPPTTRVKLSFLMRTDRPSGGFSHGVNIYVNGTMLIAAENRHLKRLLNKPLNFPYKQWKGVTYDTRRWYRPKTGWVMMDNKNWESSQDQCWLNDPQWSRYVLAIEDLLHADRPNTIKFTNDHGGKSGQKSIVLDNVTLFTDPTEAGFGQGAASDPFPNRPPRRTPKFTKPPASVDPDNGGLVIKLGKDTYRIASIFSYPNGGYNLLGPGPSPESEEQAFAKSLSVIKVDDDTWTATAVGEHYSLKRCVKLFDNAKIQIKDQITNTSPTDLGLIVKHYLRFDRRIIPHVFMSGDSDPPANNVSKRPNPSLYVPVDGGGLGLLAEDDFFRMQMQCFYDEDDLHGTGIKTERMTIPPGQSYCMEWSVYAYKDPDGSGDYFDFINLVRNDWNTNFRLDGPYIFATSTELLDTDHATLAKVAAAHGTFACVLMSSFIDPADNESRSWFTHFYYGKKSGMFDRWLIQMDAAVAKMRKSTPNVKLLHKYESLLNVLDDIDKFPDSQVRDQNKELVPYPPYRDLAYPTLTNSYGRGMTKMLEFIMNRYKVDGLFWRAILSGRFAANFNKN